MFLAWPLYIDWTCLPSLETLYLDLRACVSHELNGRLERKYKDRIRSRAGRLPKGKLKKLVVAGLCSPFVYLPGDTDWEAEILSLFQLAMAKGFTAKFAESLPNRWYEYDERLPCI